MPDNGVDAMKVADVDGVRLAGFLIDAGTGDSPQLLQVGAPGSAASHSGDPTTVQDVFARIDGAGPGQAAVQNGSTRGFAAYKVDDTVTTHEAWGLGSYRNFTTDPSIVMDHGFESTTTAGVRFHDLLVISLGGNGQYAHVIDGTGPGTSGTSTTASTVTTYP